MTTKSPDAVIVQFSDEAKTLPDGSKIIYAENEEKIVLYHKLPFESPNTYIFDRKSASIHVNNKKGGIKEKKRMIQLGQYFLQNCTEDSIVTLDVYTGPS